MKIVREGYEKVIIVSDNQELSIPMLSSSLQLAYSLYLHIKYVYKGYYIKVSFSRDRDITVASNIRNPQFLHDYYMKDKQGWSIPLIKSFIYQWMNTSRRALY